jgi:hypothetical protein
MISVTIEETKTQLVELIEQVERGEWLDKSFWEPLPDDELKLWEGG